MGRPREYVRVITRCLVARRQLREHGIVIRRPREMSLTVYLEMILLPELQNALNTTQPLQWEHNPALGLRKKRTGADGKIEYSPKENDHRFIEYKPKDLHLQKTTGRKPGAERTVTTKGSDIGLMKKFRRLEGKPKRKRRIASPKGFPKGRPLRSRSNFR